MNTLILGKKIGGDTLKDKHKFAYKN